MDIVEFDRVKKQLRKLPSYIVDKLRSWARDVEKYGIRQVRNIPGYHDEPLKGERKGQRSIRLSKSYRAIYTENNEGEINIIRIEEVNKHEY